MNNYVLCSVDGENIPVRLVGIIEGKECEAILNVEKAANKVATSESVIFDSFAPYYVGYKRFVLVVRSNSKYFNNKEPIIFISSVIESAHYTNGGWNIFCRPLRGIYSGLYRFKVIEKGVSTKDEQNNT